MSNSSPIILVQEVSKWYGDVQVLKKCSLEIQRGEVVVVCGPSGSGKSTLIKCVNALEPIQEGKIFFNETHVNSVKANLPMLRSKLGMVFQQFELFPHMTVLENLCIAQEKVLRRTHGVAVDKARGILDRVGLSGFESRYPQQLSGGQQQRVAIARSLAMEPVAMLFDEPTSALDPEMINEVLEVMTSLAQDASMTMMIVTHEMSFAKRVANRIVFMDGGEIVEDSPSGQFYDAPKSDRARNFLEKIIHH